MGPTDLRIAAATLERLARELPGLVDRARALATEDTFAGPAPTRLRDRLALVDHALAAVAADYWRTARVLRATADHLEAEQRRAEQRRHWATSAT